MTTSHDTPAQGPRPRGWTVARVFGAPVLVTATWPVGAVVLTLLFAPSVSDVLPGSQTRAYAVAAGYAVLLFVSVLLHELAHAAVAHARGKTVHQVSLTLWGGQTSFSDDDPRASTSILVSLAGPLTNLVIGGAAWFVLTRTALTDGSDVTRLLVGALALANLFVGAFNLVPGLPLDGGQVLEGIVWRVTGRRSTGTRIAGWIGRVVAVLVVVGFVAVPMARGDRPSVYSIVWALLIATFLWQGATFALRSATVLEGIDAADLRAVVHPVIGVPSTTPLDDVVTALARYHEAATPPGPQPAYGARRTGLEPVVLVSDGPRLVGTVDPAALRSVPPASLASTTALAVAVPLGADAVVDAADHDERFTARAALLSARSPVVAVVTAGRVTGALVSAEVQDRLRAHGLTG